MKTVSWLTSATAWRITPSEGTMYHLTDGELKIVRIEETLFHLRNETKFGKIEIKRYLTLCGKEVGRDPQFGEDVARNECKRCASKLKKIATPVIKKYRKNCAICHGKGIATIDEHDIEGGHTPGTFECLCYMDVKQ